MKQIGIIGLGGISQKAYLPFMRQLKDIHWHIFTRNQEVLREVASLFHQVTVYDSAEELAAADLDGVFIHTATVAHFETAQLFLKQGIPVYMDKPLTEDYETSRILYDLAEQAGTFLMAGFNRRFAPKVLELAKQTNKRRILVEKNDVNRTGPLTFKLFDFFIHPLDTALFLVDEPLQTGHFRYHGNREEFSQVSVTLETASTSIVASMNLQSGSRREIMEVQTPEATHHLENLDEYSIHTGTQIIQDGFGSWDTTLYKRGFETAILSFLEAIETKVNPVSPSSSLLSHWICDQINRSKTNSGPLIVTLPD